MLQRSCFWNRARTLACDHERPLGVDLQDVQERQLHAIAGRRIDRDPARLPPISLGVLELLLDAAEPGRAGLPHRAEQDLGRVVREDAPDARLLVEGLAIAADAALCRRPPPGRRDAPGEAPLGVRARGPPDASPVG